MPANSFSTIIEEAFSTGIQKVLTKILVADKICGKEAQMELREGGDTFNKPFIPRGVTQSYSEGTGVTKQTFTATNESLSLDQKKVYNFILDETDMRQQKRRASILANMTMNAMDELQTVVDGDFFYRYQDADMKYGSGGLTTSSTVAGFTLSVSNATTSFGSVFAHLLNKTGGITEKFLVVDPFHADVIENAAIGNTFNLADSAFQNGYVGNFKGYKMYVSNNLTSEVALTFTGVGVAAEYITLNGTTLTWAASLGATKGVIHVCDSATNEAINIAAVLNAPGTNISEAAGTGYVAYTDQENLHNLDGFVASNPSAGVVLIKSKRGRMTIGTDAITNATYGTQVVHAIAGEVGAIELAYQEKGRLFVNDSPVDSSGNTLLAKEFNHLSMYGIKTFDEGDARIVDIQINA
jgi:hypothetical protein